MTEALWPKYAWLLSWVLGVYATRLMPTRVENWATMFVLAGFVVWFDRNTHRTRRGINRRLESLHARQGTLRDAKTVASRGHLSVPTPKTT